MLIARVRFGISASAKIALGSLCRLTMDGHLEHSPKATNTFIRHLVFADRPLQDGRQLSWHQYLNGTLGALQSLQL
jgi:hypothetical protein